MDQNDILILEPEQPPDVRTESRLGEILGYPRLKFTDGEGCLTIVGKHTPRLVLVSHNPPHCDAITILKRLKGRHPEILVVVDIPDGDPVLVRKAFLAGSSDCLLDGDLDDIGSLKLRLSGMLPDKAGRPGSGWVNDELERIRPVLDSICDSISIQDTELNILYQNPAHKGMAGDRVGEKCFEAYAEGPDACERCPVSRCFEDGMPHRLVKSGPEGLVVDITASPLRDRDGNIWGGLEVVRDITDQKRLEDALRNTAEGVSTQTGESFFHSLTEYLVKTLGVSTSFIGLIDENDPALSRTISFYHGGAHGNNFWYRIDGTPCGEVSRRGLCVFRDSVQDSFPTIEMLRQIDAKCYVGAPLISSDGRPLGVLSVLDTKLLENTTLVESLLMIFASRVSAELDRLKVENSLRESGRRLTEMLENVQLAAVMLDTKGAVTFANDYLLKLAGLEREEVVGNNWFHIFVPPEDAADLEGYFLKMIAAKDVPHHHENDILTSGRERRHVSWSNTLLKDDSGGVIGVCSIGEDITARKIAEQERSELFHMMTHDIKGPLSIVNGYSELILADDTPEPAREYAGEIRKASKRIFGLIEDMLTLSAMEASVGESRHEPVSVQELIEQAVFDLRIRADEMNIEVGLKFQTEYRPIVYGDRNLLRRAIENLLINAINYNKFAGGVSIETGRDGDSRIFVEVSDTGVGIPDTDMGHIFDKYYRSKVTGKRHGTGLGLAIVKQAVESCGGAVSARNNPDGGATFRVELPLEG